MRPFAIALLLLAASAAAQPDEWVLVFEEDFDADDAAFAARWDLGTHTFTGNLAQFVPGNATVANGLLTLNLTDQPAGARALSGAELRSDNGWGFFTYGRFEARIRAARGSGVVSSLFTFRYDPWQEIDIEFKGRDTEAVQANVFYNPGPLGASNNMFYEPPPFPFNAPLAYDAADEFHDYAFEWEPGTIRWFVDGVKVAETVNAGEVPFLPQQLMMNLWATDYAWAGPFDPGALPAEAQYDWVRVYRRRSTMAVFDAFNDGFVGDALPFSGAGGATVSSTVGVGGGSTNAVRLTVDPAVAGGYAGVALLGEPGIVDASPYNAVVLVLRPTLAPADYPLTLEVNLHEDVDLDGLYDGSVEDEVQATVTLMEGEYQQVFIPFDDFTDDNSVFPGTDDGFDFSRLSEVVLAVADLPDAPFTIDVDWIRFVNNVASEAGPSPPAVSVSPNPTAGAAAATVSLAAPSRVVTEVFDMVGRRVGRATVEAAAGEARVPLPTAGLAPGMYAVRVTTSAGVSTVRLSVAR